MHTVRIYALYHAKQPIIHTEESIGNISKIKKLRVLYEGKVASIPAISGNSFRGQLRDILADQMFHILTEGGTKRVQLSPDYYGVLYSGGVMAERSKMGIHMMELASAIPMLRVMGSAFGNVMLPSKVAVTHIIPYAVETLDVLEPTVAALSEERRRLLPSQPPKQVDLLFNDGPLTRRDDSKDLTKQRYAQTQVELSDAVERTTAQMIYYVECIPPGTYLLQEIYTKYALDELELGCLFDGLHTFLQAPSIGGRSAAGYGQVDPRYDVHINGQRVSWPTDGATDPESMVTEAIREYKQHVQNRRKEILDVLGATEVQRSAREDEHASSG